MPLPEYPVDQGRGKFRKVVPYTFKPLRIRKVVIYALDPFLPFVPALFSYVGIYEELFVAGADHSRHPGQARRVLILYVHLHPVFLADIIEVVNALPVLLIICCIHFHNGMQALLSGMYKACHWKLQFPDDRVLLFDLHCVRFYQCITVFCNVLVFTSIAVKRVETDPRPCLFVIIPEDGPDISLAVIQFLNQLSCRPVPVSALREPSGAFFVSLFPAFCHIPYIFTSLK